MLFTKLNDRNPKGEVQTRVTYSLVYPIGVHARVVSLPALGTAFAFGYGGPGHGLGFRPRPA